MSTTYRELYAHYTDGRTERVRIEEETPRGRESIDRAAFAEMGRDKVAYCSTKVSTKVAATGGKGRYR